MIPFSAGHSVCVTAGVADNAAILCKCPRTVSEGHGSPLHSKANSQARLFTPEGGFHFIIHLQLLHMGSNNSR